MPPETLIAVVPGYPSLSATVPPQHPPPMPIASLLLALVLCLTSLGAAEGPKTGRFQATFSERSPHSAWSELASRYGWSDPAGPVPAAHAYDLAKEPYDVYVPKDYDGSVAYGLIAYVNAGKGGGHGQYAGVLDKHRLIWIGGTQIGNDRDVPSRIGLTIDAVHNLRQRYRIDPDRIYVSGTSGGGRTASMMGITYADVFTGGAVYLIGCNNPIWPQDKEDADRVRALAPGHRFAFMTGSDDFNKPGTQKVHAAYQAERLPHLKYFEASGVGHANPPPALFDEAIAFLDAPLIARVQASFERGEALSAKGKRAEAWAAYREAAASAVHPEVAAKAGPKVAELATAIDADLAVELDRLLGAKPAADKVRAFAATWSDFPTGETAKGHADRLAGVELETLLAKDAKLALTPLRAFVRAWEGFPVRERALAALELQAKAAWAPVAALPAGDRRLRALARFATEWAPTPTAVAAATTASDELEAALAAILAEPRPRLRGQKLQAFATAWKGTASGARAEREVAALVAELQAAEKKK